MAQSEYLNTTVAGKDGVTYLSHRHEAVTTNTRCWTACVDPRHGHSQISHGGVVHSETCSCGAVRFVESTGTGRSHATKWTAANKAAR